MLLCLCLLRFCSSLSDQDFRRLDLRDLQGAAAVKKQRTASCGKKSAQTSMFAGAATEVHMRSCTLTSRLREGQTSLTLVSQRRTSIKSCERNVHLLVHTFWRRTDCSLAVSFGGGHPARPQPRKRVGEEAKARSRDQGVQSSSR